MRFKIAFAFVAVACIVVFSAFIPQQKDVENSKQIDRSSEPIGGSVIERY